jgi:uncharacterized protein YqgC (DUF456 family)
MHVIGWIIAIGLILIGLAGTVLPGLPGTILIFLGLFLGAWLDGFNHVGGLLVVILGLLSFVAYILDAVVVGFAARAVNASREAMIGAMLGMFVGVFTGFVGLLIWPFIGAVIGEYLAQRDLARAGRVGLATWVGLALGVAGRLALGFSMIGIFIIAFLWKH